MEIASELKDKIREIWQKEQNGNFQSEASKNELAEIAQSLRLDLRDELSSEINEPTPDGKSIVTWVHVRESTYPVMQILESMSLDEIETTICWMLRQHDLKWVGAGCYRLLTNKTDRMYSACFLPGIRIATASGSGKPVT